jgi:signal transduction histidine kinase
MMKLWQKSKKLRQYLDFNSLQLRLTLGIVALSSFGLGSLTFWTGWRMQEIIVSSHEHSIESLAKRLPQDIVLYSEMMSVPNSIKKAIDNLATDRVFIWVKTPQGKILSKTFKSEDRQKNEALLNLEEMPLVVSSKKSSGHYWVICSSKLEVKKADWGKLYIAQDITEEQLMFDKLLKNIVIVSLFLIAGLAIVIAFYIKQSLRPLQTLSQLTQAISVDKLDRKKINLENAPSEIQELSQTFAEMLGRISQAWDDRRQLANNISHELRTPLTIVSGYIQSILKRGNNLTEMQKEALTIAASEAERTVQLLQDLLDLARLDNGRMSFQFEKVTAAEIVKEVAEMAEQYSDRQITINCDTNKNAKIAVDVNRCKQILLNLIDNAVKYSPDDRPISIEVQSTETRVLIQVCDRGIGIPLAQQARIFEPFYRVDEARSRDVGGVGLGLSIVKTLVEGMNGLLSVRSELDRGSTFIVSFPRIDRSNKSIK